MTNTLANNQVISDEHRASMDYATQHRAILTTSLAQIKGDSLAARKLRTFIMKVYNEYGYVDFKVKQLKIDDSYYMTLPKKYSSFFGKNADDFFDSLGIDTSVGNGAPGKQGMSKRSKAISAREWLKTSFLKGEGWSWDTCKIAQNIVEYNDYLDDNRYDESITESDLSGLIKQLMYWEPTNYSGIVECVASKFSLDANKIIEAFEKQNGYTIADYSTQLNEDVGGWLKGKAAEVGDKVVGKYAFGNTKVAAQTRVDTRKDREDLLRKWTVISQRNKLTASRDNILQFLYAIGTTEPVIKQMMKKYAPFFKIPTNVNAQTAKAGIKGVIPNGAMRQFFDDLLTFNNRLDLANQANAKRKGQVNPSGVAAPNAPAQPANPQNTTTQAGNTVTAPASTKPIKAQVKSQNQNTADMVKSYLNGLTPAEIGKFLNREVFQNLSSADAAQVLQTFLSKKP